MCIRFIQFPDYFKSILQLVLKKGLLLKKNFFYVTFIISRNKNLISCKKTTVSNTFCCHSHPYYSPLEK